MDSKPIAILIAIVITITTMGGVALYGNNIFSGTSTSTELLPKTVEILSIDENHLEANIQFTNQGTGTLQNVVGTVEINGEAYHRLVSNTDTVEPFKTLSLSGTIKAVPWDTNTPEGGNTTRAGGTAIANDAWSVYPGESVLLRVIVDTTSGDRIEKLQEITVR